MLLKKSCTFDQLSYEWNCYIIKDLVDFDSFLTRTYTSMSVDNQFWFMRKSFNGDNHIRLRFKNTVSTDEIEQFFSAEKINFNKIIYEPEVFLFGGERGTELAHNYFCLSSNLLVNYLVNKESIKMFNYIVIYISKYIIEKVNADNFEIWDCWSKIFQLREFDLEKYKKIIEKNYRSFELLSDMRVDELLSNYSENFREFFLNEYIPNLDILIEEHKNHYFKGDLTRGIRSILSAIIIFNWNIFGLKAGLQGSLALMFMNKYKPL
ncbi:thiopeptide-type bacteriocin biosynthesis protein [Paenibacillus sp. WLX1005]|uniref:thiopeptide-type bacteriocin biosynthesis protein n=1 Tax=Paenibacillus sp. WLX1005 TaxID=3243766 RepID=UPI003984505F